MNDALYYREVRSFKQRLLCHYLSANKWRVGSTARALGINRTYLWLLIRTLLRPDAGRPN
jgi:hypothetical protein